MFCPNNSVLLNLLCIWILLYLADNFGLFTDISVCKFLRGWRSYGLKPFLLCPLYMFIHFSAAFCTAHCALENWLRIMGDRYVHYYYYYYDDNDDDDDDDDDNDDISNQQ